MNAIQAWKRDAPLFIHTMQGGTHPILPRGYSITQVDADQITITNGVEVIQTPEAENKWRDLAVMGRMVTFKVGEVYLCVRVVAVNDKTFTLQLPNRGTLEFSWADCPTYTLTRIRLCQTLL